MRLVTPDEIEHVAWDGYLEAAAVTFKGGGTGPRVTLGQPAWWPAEQALENQTGQKWSPPPGDRRFTLIRLACTLHPPTESHSRYSEATLMVYLRPRSGGQPVTAFDLFPQRRSAESKRKFSLGLGPDLKFAETFEASLFEVGAEIEYLQAFPVIQGYGLGESQPYWTFAHHAAAPLLGTQSVYLVAAAPAAAGGLRLSLDLSATLETCFGPLRLGPPQSAQTRLSWLIEG